MTDTSGTAKTPKVTPNPNTAAVTEVDVTDGDDKKEKPLKEVPLVHDQGFFQHDTGDTYDGEFEAKKKDLSVKMHGQGVYTTAEGDIYTGHWDADKIVASDQAIISYNDGAKFEGILKDWSYTGQGTYTYPDGSVLTGEFSDNCPVGNLILTDPNGHTWLGKADLGFGWFEPVNHFYELLETTHTRVKRRHKTVPDASANAKLTPAATKATPASTKAAPASTKATPASTKATTASTKATSASTKALKAK